VNFPLKRVMILSTSFELQTEMEKLVTDRSKAQFGFETTASFGQTPHWWFVSGPNLLVVDLPEELPLLDPYLSRMTTHLPRSLPVVVLCSSVERNIMEAAAHFQRSRVITRPVNASFLLRAIHDLSAHLDPGAQTTQPRYLTDLRIELVASEGREVVPARMKNISLGGFYCETQRGDASLQINEKVQLRLSGRSYEAKVIWMKKLASDFYLGFGCRFTEESEELLAQRLSEILNVPKGEA